MTTDISIPPPTPADLAALSARHVRIEQGCGEWSWCRHCVTLWPCDTAVALTALEGARALLQDIDVWLMVTSERLAGRRPRPLWWYQEVNPLVDRIRHLTAAVAAEEE